MEKKNTFSADTGKFRSQAKLLDDALRKVLSAGFSRKAPADRQLAAYFKEHRNCGSRDRAMISECIYSLLRFWGFLRAYLPDARRAELERGSIRFTQEELGALVAGAGFIAGENPATAENLLALHHLPPLPRIGGTICDRARQLGRYFGCPDREYQLTELVPQWILEKLPANLDRERYFQLLTQRPPMWLRFQCDDRAPVLNELQSLGAELLPAPPLADALAVRAKINLFTLESYRSGLFEIQDLASQCVGLIAAPRPGERWYDPCAGAGGKTLQLAQLMKRKGSVLSGDVRAEKLEDLRKRARRAGFPNVAVKAHNGGIWHGRHPFDGVLIDAPCSCSGVWRRNPGAQWKLDDAEVDELAALQRKILENHAQAVRPGGVLVYATCSLFDQENSAVVRDFLAAHPEYKLDPFEHPVTGKIMPGMVRIDSADGNCDALFAARMRRFQ